MPFKVFISLCQCIKYVVDIDFGVVVYDADDDDDDDDVVDGGGGTYKRKINMKLKIVSSY